MTSPGPLPGAASQRQKRMGPAPFASFEDLSDEVRSRLESPEDKNVAGSVVRLPGIREDATPTSPGLILERATRSPSPAFQFGGISLIGAPQKSMLSTSPKSSIKVTTPRIDISRASSSSHHDSRDSTPERELFESHDPNSAKLGLGFREDGTLDLRSSTEELDFQEPNDKKKGKTRPPSPSLHDDLGHNHQRKDSQCSDIVLLSISGRTSRLSSIGSQGSAQSRLSNASHLSVVSGQSRCSSPHKMVLETSFCGTKPPSVTGKVQSVEEPAGTKVEAEMLEKVLLSRKLDPTEAVLAEGIRVGLGEDSTKGSAPEKPARKPVQSVKSDITITVDKPNSNTSNNSSQDKKLPKKIVSASGIEYIYIPLKGPLPVDPEEPVITKTKLREVKSASYQTKSKTQEVTPSKTLSKSATPSPIIRKRDEEPKYIRIKLKPDYMYSDDQTATKKPPDSLDIQLEPEEEPRSSSPGKSIVTTPSASPKLPRNSVTPSPSVSRKSSFASLFKSKEASPESPTKHSSTKRSKSRDRTDKAPSSTESIDSKTKHKTSVLSIFKSSPVTKKPSPKPSEDITLDGIGKVEFTFKDKKKYEVALDGDSIRIPLHSPTYYEGNKNILQEWKTSSQDSQETVIEACSRFASVVVEPVPQEVEEPQASRQSSTSSENVVFLTKLGSNEIFTTKLPKEPPSSPLVTKVQINGHVPRDEVKPEEVKRTISQEVIKRTTSREFKQEELQEIKKPISRQESQEKLKRTISREFTQEVIRPISQEVSLEKSQDKVKRPISQEVKGEVKRPISQEVKGEVKRPISQEVKSEVFQEAKRTTSQNSSKEEVNRPVLKEVSSQEPLDHNSSESERDSELDFPTRLKKDLDLKLELNELNEPERKNLVLQQDSFEDELPYIPTTLPQERSAAIPIVPVKQRSTFEMKTCPIDRPRSTTPINPSCLDDYCEEVLGSTFNSETITKTIEKLKISLPRNDSSDKLNTGKIKSPRKTPNWTEFETKLSRPSQSDEVPPPLPPKGVQKNWINFEEIPEKRKAPKRIQTIPSRGHIEVPEHENIVYNYVNPEECKCECHEQIKQRVPEPAPEEADIQEDELPLLVEDEEDKSLKLESKSVVR